MPSWRWRWDWRFRSAPAASGRVAWRPDIRARYGNRAGSREKARPPGGLVVRKQHEAYRPLAVVVVDAVPVDQGAFGQRQIDGGLHLGSLRHWLPPSG